MAVQWGKKKQTGKEASNYGIGSQMVCRRIRPQSLMAYRGEEAQTLGSQGFTKNLNLEFIYNFQQKECTESL